MRPSAERPELEVALIAGCGYNGQVQEPSTAEVRQWARERGFAVGDRGRLSPGLVALYLAEHPQGPATDGDGEREAARSTATRSRTSAPAPRSGTVRARSPWNWPQLEQRGAPPRSARRDSAQE